MRERKAEQPEAIARPADGGLQTVARTLRLLGLFVERPSSGWSLAELARVLELSKSTTSRMLATLVAAGYLDRDDDSRRYRLGPVAVALGGAALASLDIRQIALPAMRALTDETGETSLLHVVRAGESFCIEKVESSQAVRVSYDIGSRGPLYAGGSGKCLLAFFSPAELDAAIVGFDFQAYTKQTPTDAAALRQELAEARRRGFVESSGEMDPGVSSVGVPLLDAAGTLYGGITVVCPTMRWTGTHRARCIAAAQRAARTVQAQLSGNAQERRPA